MAPNVWNKGNWLNEEIIDSTATLAMQICAAGMWTGLTSPTRPWFKLGVGLPGYEPDADAAEWLEDTEDLIYMILAESNFYNIMAQAFQDVATFGTAPVIIYEDQQDVIRCYLPCAGEYFLATGFRLNVDTLLREFVLTVYAIVEMFHLENCPPDVQNMWAMGGASWDREFVVAHSIEPNTSMLPRARSDKPFFVVPKKFAWCEVYWLRGQATEKPLSIRGFHEAPFFAARWSVVSNNPYGRSPGWDALGDTKQIQLETVRKAEYVEKGVRPPMGGNPELKNEPASIQPGHLTYVSTDGQKKGFWPLYEISAQWLPGITADIEKVADRINRCFFVDLFMAITRMEGVQPRNELELTQRDLERLQTLGPFVNLWVTECATPALMRVIGIASRRGLIKPKPASLRNVPLGLTFVSMMKLAQRAAETATMERTFAVAGNLSSAAKAAGVPDPIRTLNLDKALKEYAEHVSFPDSIFYTRAGGAAARSGAGAGDGAAAGDAGDIAGGAGGPDTLEDRYWRGQQCAGRHARQRWGRQFRGASGMKPLTHPKNRAIVRAIVMFPPTLTRTSLVRAFLR